MISLQIELYILYFASVLYTAFTVLSIINADKLSYYKSTIALGILAFITHTSSIAIHWYRVAHGPFINLYEILNSNVWSLFLAVVLYMIFFKNKRYITKIVMPVILILLLWLLTTKAGDSYLPPTYNTIWLYFHVVSGKVFFALLLLATGLAVYSLSHRKNANVNHNDIILLAYKFLTIAFVFDSFMLFFGAIWAQDAWGRYWSWDPLETWAFLTWLSIVFALHIQDKFKQALLFRSVIIISFILAFLTFFGVPFISKSAHQGMV
ncbi:Cytochrome c-type biogenesis protein CcsA/ResC [hydrothermal vent metagenome]|uniref:Cytochrome c-type biogenesis protein CcsA/ResC n=1 Tax=hydrothermal vent metagenome TaxID=652676 RepID=A0A3B1B8T5_9ZZZZ